MVEPFVLLTAAVAAAAVSQKRSTTTDVNPIINEIRRRISRIDPRFARIPLKEDTSSFTYDKSVIHLCIRDPRTGAAYDMNTLMYVVLHELAHVVSRKHDPGHGAEFDGNFRNILRHAAAIGIYDPRRPIVKRYCGTS